MALGHELSGVVESIGDEVTGLEPGMRVVLNPTAGGNFSFGAGMGVAIEVEKTNAAELPIHAPDAAFIRIADVELEFIGKEVNENVTV